MSVSRLSILATAFRGGFILIVCLCTASGLIGQVILSEIMSNPAGGETSIPGGDSNEFIELYNTGTDTVDLSGWTFDDGDSDDELIYASFIMSPLPDDPDGIYDTMLLPPGGYAIILDPEYIDPANDQPYDWPAGAVILTIATTTDLGGSRLATTDPITLYNNVGVPIDSFPNPFDPGDGVSAERTAPVQTADWSASIALSGSTPGYRNSHWPFASDLSLDSLTTPENPATTSPVTVFAHIKNVGESGFDGGKVYLFRDTLETEVLDSANTGYLGVGESGEIALTADVADGSYHFCARLSGDDNPMNDEAILAVFVGPTGWPICITEIMFKPFTGEPEWIELYNWGEQAIDLSGWRAGDAVDLYDIPDTVLSPESFLVLCADTAAFADTICEGAILLEPSNWPALNNDNDIVRLFDSDGLPRHSVGYDESAMGNCMDYGISAEVVEIGNSSVGCSPAGSTPGCENAIWLVRPDKCDVDADPNPFDPSEGPTIIDINLPGTGITVAIYDRLGRKLVTLADPETPKGLSFPWDGRDSSGQVLPAGMYILFAKDSESNSAKTVIAIKGGR